MEEIQVFRNADFGEIRTVRIDGEPWFVGRDVAEKLGYSNTRDALSKHVDDEDKGVVKRDTLGGEQTMTIINESGLYSLVLSSKLPSAKAFKRWITAEVIPAIRRHGGYLTPATAEELLADPDLLIRLAQSLKDEREKSRRLSARIDRDKPYALLGKALTNDDGSMLISDFAKVLTNTYGMKMGRTKLFAWLREHGYLIAGSTRPHQEYIDEGLFRVKDVRFKFGTNATTYITIKGQIRITQILIDPD